MLIMGGPMDRGFQKRCVTLKVRTPCSSCRGFTTKMLNLGKVDGEGMKGEGCRETPYQNAQYGRGIGQGISKHRCDFLKQGLGIHWGFTTKNTHYWRDNGQGVSKKVCDF